MKNETETKIQEILNQMQEMFQKAVGPRNRREYMDSIGVSGRDWHFSLNVDKIITSKIPANVIGCTGRAKLFCELAKSQGIDAFVVCTAKYDDWAAVKNGENKTINGHQINAVEINGKLMVFDAGRRKLKFIDTNLKPGIFIDAMDNGNLDYMVSVVVPGDKFQHVNTYQKLRNLYTSGDMNNEKFTIKPKLFVRAARMIGKKIIKKKKLLSRTQEARL